ncbi:MAG TPA: aldehyde dehydrogenase family protein [Steroidobacteraceae bacterium]|nr:aldehyde dehydrogenase family protein [Steroidobacteraceae bacterium]
MTAAKIHLKSVMSADAYSVVTERHANLIGADWTEALSGERLDVIDPGTGAILTTVPASSAEDVHMAVAAARKALEGPWSSMTGAARGRLLWKLADLLSTHAEALAQIEALDTGRPLSECSIVDLPGSVAMLEYMAGWASKINGETMGVSMPGDFHAYTTREPVGVVAVVVPWNYPLELAVWRAAPALAAGCTVIIKPAEQTPLSTIRLGRLVQQAGFPPGVVNIVVGDGRAGAALAAHPDVDAISFTGSTEVGRSIIAASAGNIKRVFLELGGKSPMIVLEDADLEQAIPGLAGAIFFSSGQVCTAGSRLFVHERIFDEVVDGIVQVATRLRLGHSLSPGTQLGPLVSETQLRHVMGHIERAAEQGVHFATGGGRGDGSGYFVKPAVAVNVKPDMAIYREEVFGPVLCAMRFGAGGIDEVVAAANDSIYGLHASIWTRELKSAHLLARRIKAGNVCINTHNFFDPAFPMGGYKQSGWGRAAGFPAIEHYTEIKGVVARL